MANPVPLPQSSDSSGLADSQWISDTRNALRDYPRWAGMTWTADGVNGALGPNSFPFVVPRPPIWDGGTGPTVFNATTSTTYTVITSGTPTSGQVFMNFNTGEVYFSSPPTSGNSIQVAYQTVRWPDQMIENSLYAGLRAMFPTVGKTYVDDSIGIQVLVWDYALPVWAQDPRSRVLKVEVRDPNISVEPWRPFDNWEMVGVGTIHLPGSQSISPVGHIRITGWGPYLTLGDLEPQMYELPIWYALSKLLPNEESKRIRQDTMVPLTQDGGQQPGLLTQTGDYYNQRFESELARLAKPMGPGWYRPMRTVYQRLHA